MKDYLSQKFHASGTLGIGVELEQGAKVAQWIALDGPVHTGSLSGPDNALHLITVNQARQVTVCHKGSRQRVALLHSAWRVRRACKG